MNLAVTNVYLTLRIEVDRLKGDFLTNQIQEVVFAVGAITELSLRKQFVLKRHQNETSIPFDKEANEFELPMFE